MRPPMDVNNCTSFNLRKAARVVTHQYDDILKSSGLRSTQFSLLTVLSKSGAETISNLAHKLVMDRTTLTRNLKPLQSQGWVQRVPGEDRRTRAWSITSSGRKVLAEALPLWQKAQRQTIEQLTQKRWSSLLNQLFNINEHLSSY
jgi:DNA-binding MarR family transcriptional regulator